MDARGANKPRLLVVTSMFPRWIDDSEPAFVFELCRRLTKHFDVQVLAPHARGAALSENMDGVAIVRYRYAPEALQTLAYDGGIMPKLRRHPSRWLLVPLLLVAQMLSVRRALRRWRPDIIHAHWIIPQGLVVTAAASRTPLVVTSHGGDLFGLRGGWLTRLKVGVMRRARRVTVVSNSMRELVRDMGIDAAKISVAPMGVDFAERFAPDNTQPRSHREILFMGRLAEKKGLRFLLEAAPRIFEAYTDAFITIAGFGPDEHALRAQATRLGIDDKVHFIGPVSASEVPALYRRAAIFVAPFVEAKSGDQEGLGLVVVEAIACECPVVVSDLPATRDILRADSDVLISPGDPDRLFTAISAVLHDPMAAAAAAKQRRAAVCEAFDWSVSADRYAQLLSAILAECENAA